MILPVVAYGHPVLKKIAEEITPDYPGLQQLIADMFETMYHTEGVGLAAPQINKSMRLFVIDAEPFVENYPEAKGFKKVFINPEIVEVSEETWTFREGCLSLPDMNEDVERPSKITINYLDENFVEHEEEYECRGNGRRRDATNERGVLAGNRCVTLGCGRTGQRVIECRL